MSRFKADVIQNESGQAFLVIDNYDSSIEDAFGPIDDWEERARWHITDSNVVLNYINRNIILGYN